MPYPGVQVGQLANVEEAFGFANTPMHVPGSSGGDTALPEGLEAVSAIEAGEQLQVDDGLQMTAACFNAAWQEQPAGSAGSAEGRHLPQSNCNLPVPPYLS